MGTVHITSDGQTAPAIQTHACTTCQAIAALLKKAQAATPKPRVSKAALRIDTKQSR